MWLPLPVGLVAVHVLANVVWIGSILSTAMLVARAPLMADAPEVGALARRIYLRLATPAFVASFATGVARFGLEARMYAHFPWMHAKLTLAVAVIVLHHVIGARAKRVASGKVEAARGAGVLGIALLACAAGAVLLGVAKALP
jgi:putative membrane protein